MQTAACVAPPVVHATVEPHPQLETRLVEVKLKLEQVDQQLEQIKYKRSDEPAPTGDDFVEQGYKVLLALHTKLEQQKDELEQKRTTERHIKAGLEKQRRSLELVHRELTRRGKELEEEEPSKKGGHKAHTHQQQLVRMEGPHNTTR